jgi:hypothetical protein
MAAVTDYMAAAWAMTAVGIGPEGAGFRGRSEGQRMWTRLRFAPAASRRGMIVSLGLSSAERMITALVILHGVPSGRNAPYLACMGKQLWSSLARRSLGGHGGGHGLHGGGMGHGGVGKNSI